MVKVYRIFGKMRLVLQIASIFFEKVWEQWMHGSAFFLSVLQNHPGIHRRKRYPAQRQAVMEKDVYFRSRGQ